MSSNLRTKVTLSFRGRVHPEDSRHKESCHLRRLFRVRVRKFTMISFPKTVFNPHSSSTPLTNQAAYQIGRGTWIDLLSYSHSSCPQGSTPISPLPKTVSNILNNKCLAALTDGSTSPPTGLHGHFNVLVKTLARLYHFAERSTFSLNLRSDVLCTLSMPPVLVLHWPCRPRWSDPSPKSL